MNHPVLRHLKNLYFYFSTWAIIAIIHALIFKFNQNIDWHWSILDSVVFNLFYSALGLSYWYNCRYISLEKVALTKIVGNHAFTAAFSSLIWLGVSYAILVNIFDADAYYKSFLHGSLTWRVLIGMLFYLVTISFYYVYVYSENLQLLLNCLWVLNLNELFLRLLNQQLIYPYTYQEHEKDLLFQRLLTQI